MSAFLTRILRKPQVRHLIAIDLGSHAAVRSLLFNVDEEGRDPRVVAKRNLELPIRDEAKALIPLIASHLRRLIFQYVKELGRIPDEILIGLGSQFIVNDRERATFTRQDPSRALTVGELHSLLTEHLNHRDTVRVGPETYHRFIVIPFKIELDGYPLETLNAESRGKTVTIHLFNTYATASFLSELTALRSMVGGLTVNFISNIAAIAGGVVSILNLEDALVVKIGAKMTEVILLRSGVIASAGQFASGGEAVTEAFSRALSISFSDAERLKREMATALMGNHTQAAVRAALGEAAERWRQGLAEFLDESETLVLPETIFLLGGGARLEALKQTLAAGSWFEAFTFQPRLNIVRLDAKEFARAIFRTSPPPLAGPEEVALASLAGRLIQRPATITPQPGP